jgi:predicted PurR-regulated permease PerM
MGISSRRSFVRFPARREAGRDLALDMHAEAGDQLAPASSAVSMIDLTPVVVPFALWPPRQVIRATLVVLGVVLAFWLAYALYPVLFLAFVAIVLGTALEPLIGRLQVGVKSRAAAAALTYVLVVTLFVGGLVTVAPLLAEQAIAVAHNIPADYDHLRESLAHSPSRLLHAIGSGLPVHLWQEQLPEMPALAPMDTLVQAFGYLGTLAWALFAAFLTLLLAFYWSLEGERSTRAMLLWVPAERREAARNLVDEMQEKVGDYVRGQSLLCLIVGSMALVAYLMIGLPQPLALASIVGILEAVPVFGPILGAIPALLTAFAIGPGMALEVLIANTAIQQTENFLLVPRVMDRSVGIHPIVTLLSIVAFGGLIGPLGAVMAIPLAAVMQTLLSRFVLELGALEQSAPPGRTGLSRLRYEAQELVIDVRKQVRAKDEATQHLVDELEETLEGIALDLDYALAKAEENEKRP